MDINIRASGVEDVLRQLGEQAADELTEELDKVVQRHAVKIANQAKHNAPVKSGKLKGSIHIYGRPVKLRRVIGSNVPYATRQEYEHKTKKGYFRRALWKGRKPFRDDIERTIKRKLDD
jgi:hypothetical protein